MAKTNGKRSLRSRKRESVARDAIAHLSAADRRLGELIAAIGPHRPHIRRDPFVTLVGSIVSQQISMSAAAAIQKRVVAACDGRVKPRTLRDLSLAKLRTCGLSKQKIRYLRDLSDHFASETLTARKLRRMSDEQVIEATTQVLGIGRWTAEMLLIFCLERPDVWPIDDLGIRKAARNFVGAADYHDRQSLSELAEPWRPFRSYASWYLWRSLEGPLMPGKSL